VYAEFISFLRKPIRPSLAKQAYHPHIEQYRGLCALLVLINHATVHEAMLVDGLRLPEFVRYLGAGYLSVIVFFCISGYVIGISNNHATLDVKLYIKRRLVRLYPVYIVAILICLIFTTGINPFVLIGNLLFLQNEAGYGQFHVPIFVNFVTWSLNYEVLYYILFIALFFVRPKVWHLLGGMLLLSVLLLKSPPDIKFFTLYLNGYYFWILGLFIGWQIITAKDKTMTVPLLSLLFLHLCQHHLGIGVIILHVLGIASTTNFNWLFDLPFCLMVMGILTQKDNAFLRFNKILCYTLPAFVFIYLGLHGRIFEDTRWAMCLIFWLLALVLYKEKYVSAFVLNKLTFIGKISYALYLLHAPIAMLIKYAIVINNKPVEIIVKYLLWIIVTFGLAAFLDVVAQPAIKKYFIKT